MLQSHTWQSLSIIVEQETLQGNDCAVHVEDVRAIGCPVVRVLATKCGFDFTITSFPCCLLNLKSFIFTQDILRMHTSF